MSEEGRTYSALWGRVEIRELRRRLGLSQAELARDLGTRQQTVSDWETGTYAPRGMSQRMLHIIAERAGFTYGQPPHD